MLVKICGMGDTDVMQQIAVYQPDMLGFIFYPKSPRFVAERIPQQEVANLSHTIRKVGVFVNAGFDEIVQQCDRYLIDTVQLHGNEAPELACRLKEQGYSVLKAFSFKEGKVPDYKKFEGVCDYFLFDTPSEKYGGTGEKFDWFLLDLYLGETPFLLSGGISLQDSKRLVQIDHPRFAGVDINSRFEVTPGVKDAEKVKKFIDEIKKKTL